MARRHRILSLLALLAALGAGSCGRGGDSSAPLAPQDQVLVDELVQLYKVRILRIADPPRAAALADSLRLTNHRDDLDALLQPLAEDPERGRRLLQAVYDSLKADRTELFPPQRG